MSDVERSFVLNGDVLDLCAEIEDDYFDAVFCDPPYGLSFMGKRWDHGVPSAEIWREIMRLVKPGGHIMAFGGTRTYHRLAVNIEDAGWEIRDSLMWLYGSGFPKSHNISKALDKKVGAEREVVGEKERAGGMHRSSKYGWKDTDGDERRSAAITAPATDAAKRFDGYGTALKPAYEPIVLAMKPRGKSFADCALEHGVAGLNIDGGRVGEPIPHQEGGLHRGSGATVGSFTGKHEKRAVDQGRFPANLILDEAAGDLLDAQAGDEKSRFFYTAKASKAEREAGLEGMVKREDGTIGYPRCKKCGKQKVNVSGTCQCDDPEWENVKKARKRANTHPCVKPLDLCRYFATLLLPPEREDSRKILVPFSGSGSEMIGCLAAGWDFVVGMELEQKYCEIAEKRIEYWQDHFEEITP